MPAERASRREGSPDELDDRLEVVLATRGGKRLERRLVAATFKLVAAWLNEQSRLLADSDDEPELPDAGSPVRLLPGPERPPKSSLTRREQEIASRIARGFSNRQIAEDLVITLGTTERHVANILSKLDMRSRSQVASWAVLQRLV